MERNMANLFTSFLLAWMKAGLQLVSPHLLLLASRQDRDQDYHSL